MNDDEIALAKRRAKEMNSILPMDTPTSSESSDTNKDKTKTNSNSNNKDDLEYTKQKQVASSSLSSSSTIRKPDTDEIALAKQRANEMKSILPVDNNNNNSDDNNDHKLDHKKEEEKIGQPTRNSFIESDENCDGGALVGRPGVFPGAVAVQGIGQQQQEEEIAMNLSDTDENENDVTAAEQLLQEDESSSKNFTTTKKTIRPSIVEIEAKLVEEGVVADEDREKIAEEVRQEMLQKTVSGTATILDDVEDNNNSNKKYAFLAVLSIIICAIVVILVVVLRRDEQQPTQTPTLSPTSSNPTMSLNPTWTPSSIPSDQPSVAPSIPIDNLDNRQKEQAHSLILNDDIRQPLYNNLINGTFSGIQLVCGSVSNEWWFGLWYKYRPRRPGPVTVVVCGFDGLLDVLTGDSNVNHCVTDTFPARNRGGEECNGNSISWQAELGQDYYLRVGFGPLPGPIAPNPVTGELPAEFVQPFDVKIVDNDDCDFAFGPLNPTSTGVDVTYTTVGANREDNPSIAVGSCGGASATNSRGVWYQVVGTGVALTASTCSDNTNFDTQISVFGGSGCNDLQCVAGNNDFCGIQSSVTWPSQEGLIYYLLVHGINGTMGEFDLTITKDAPRTDNDFCATAEPITTDSFTYEFTGSSADPEIPGCLPGTEPSSIASEEYSYGLWYSVNGTGSTISIITDAQISTTRPTITNIYAGSCGSLECVAFLPSASCVGSPGASCEASYCFATNAGETYYIFVGTNALETISNLRHIEIEHGTCTI